MVLRIVEVLIRFEKLGIASSYLVNHFTSDSGAFLYPQNALKSYEQAAAGENFGDSLAFLEQILKFFFTHRPAYKKYETLKLSKNTKNGVLGPPQAKKIGVPDRLFKETPLFKKPPLFVQNL